MTNGIVERHRTAFAVADANDEEIARSIRAALEADVLISDEQIHVAVKDGWVTVDGNVAHWEDRCWIEDCMRGLTGVRGLTVNIAIVTPVPETPEIEQAVQHALDSYEPRVEISR